MSKESMTVTINQREVVYTSDYPENRAWKKSALDYYIFPVLVGNYPCFIKRFESSPENISGWGLLNKLTVDSEKNLLRIYDIKKVQEDDNEVYYVFCEYLEGVTLYDYIYKQAQDPPVNLTHLTNDLFNAIRSLQTFGFWFADFYEKNILCQKDGSFVLLDVDSAQRTSDPPDNDMDCSKNYWTPVVDFYKEVLHKNDFRLSDINGTSLNYLQVPLLILRLKLFLKGGKDYNSLLDQLHLQLDSVAPEFREIYSNVIRHGKQSFSQEEISKIQEIIENKITNNENIPDVVISETSQPVIRSFSTNKSEIGKGGKFTLSWHPENLSQKI